MKLFLSFATVLLGLHSSAAAVCFPDRGTLSAAIAAIPITNSGAGFVYAPYGAIEDWCFDPLLTNSSGLFEGMPDFNAPIGQWDTSSVTDMSLMFVQAIAFNQNLDDWDTSSVTNMRGMFAFTNAFDQPLNSWNTSSVTDMAGMFLEALAFDQPLNKWDISRVTDMPFMFQGAVAFEQNLCDWSTDMAASPQPTTTLMFTRATACESPLEPMFPFTRNLCTRTCGAGPVADTCPEQAKCIEITTNQLDSDKCSAGICEFEICLTITGGPECVKSDAWARTCQKPDNVCLSGATGFGDGPLSFRSLEQIGIDTGFDQCQTVSAGETVEFLLLDGGGCGGTGGDTATINTNYGDEALCAPSQVGGVSSCVNEEEVGTACIWRTVAPSECEVEELCD